MLHSGKTIQRGELCEVGGGIVVLGRCDGQVKNFSHEYPNIPKVGPHTKLNIQSLSGRQIKREDIFHFDIENITRQDGDSN